MARVRHMLLSLLVIAGVLVAFGPSSAGVPRAAPEAMPMSMGHDSGCDHHPGTPRQDVQSCATLCCAVLPSLPGFEEHSMAAIAPVLGRLPPLLGTNPGLDPPPPRRA